MTDKIKTERLCSCKASQRDGQHMAWCPAIAEPAPMDTRKGRVTPPAETDEQIDERLAKQEARDNLRLLDYIADKIGLPHNEELSRENFNVWLNDPPAPMDAREGLVPVYIKRWRTLIMVPKSRVEEARQALSSLPSLELPAGGRDKPVAWMVTFPDDELSFYRAEPKPINGLKITPLYEIPYLPAPAPHAAGDFYLVSREIIDQFPEININNYDHDDACALNAWGCEVVTNANPAHAPHAEVRERKRVNLSGTDFLSGDETRKIDRALSPPSERETGCEVTGTERNWIEDAAHENGNYECRCCECDQMFIGHKRRVLCKLCSSLLKVAGTERGTP